MSCIAPACRRKVIAAGVDVPGLCAAHQKAPDAQKGGWISAFQRRQSFTGSPTPIDADPVYHRLWMGGRPPVDKEMRSLGAVVLGAAEYQPVMAYKGALLRCPIEDHCPTANELAMAEASAAKAAQIWKQGGRVLVTCYAGRNRSGLVTGLILLRVTRKSSAEVIEMIRAARGQNALTNRHFVRVLEAVGQLERKRG